MTKLSRRTLMKLAGGAVVAAGGPLTRAIAQPATGSRSNITVSTFGGIGQDTIKKFVEPEFKKLTGASLTYDIGGVGARYNKLLVQRNNPTLDVFECSEEQIVSGIKTGIFKPILRKSVPNLADVPAWAQSLKPGATSETIGGVPISVKNYVLCYNPERVKEPLTSWTDLWRPEFAGKIALPSPVHSRMPEFVTIAAELAGGSASNVEPGFRKLAELRPAKLTVFWTDWAPLLKGGEAILATEFAHYVESMKDDKYPIAHAIPKEKGMGSIGQLALVNRSKNEELSAVFMNVMLDPNVQRAIAAATYQGPTNQRVVLSAAEQARCNTSADQLRFFDAEFNAAARAGWTERLNLEVVPKWGTR